jgi:hypothetical protein
LQNVLYYYIIKGGFSLSTKKIKFDYFKMEIPNSITNLQQILDTNLQCQIGTLVKYREYQLRLESYREEGNIRIGTVDKINLHTLPPKVNINVPGVISDLGLQNNEGVANLTSFVIDPNLHVVVLQRNSQGVRAGSFVHLLENLLNQSNIGLNIMLERDVINKLNKMRYFSKFIVRIASPNTAQDFEDLGVRDSARLAQYYNARDLQLQFGIGTGSNSGPLALQRVKDTVNSLLNANANVQVDSLIIRGKEFEDEKITPLDLIKQRITFEIDVPVTNRMLAIDNLERAVWQAYETNFEELEHYQIL